MTCLAGSCFFSKAKSFPASSEQLPSFDLKTLQHGFLTSGILSHRISILAGESPASGAHPKQAEGREDVSIEALDPKRLLSVGPFVFISAWSTEL